MTRAGNKIDKIDNNENVEIDFNKLQSSSDRAVNYK